MRYMYILFVKQQIHLPKSPAPYCDSVIGVLPFSYQYKKRVWNVCEIKATKSLYVYVLSHGSNMFAMFKWIWMNLVTQPAPLCWSGAHNATYKTICFTSFSLVVNAAHIQYLHIQIQSRVFPLHVTNHIGLHV